MGVETVIVSLLLLCAFSQAAVYDYYPNTPNFANDLLGKSLHAGDVVNFHASSPGGSATYDFANVGSTYHWVGSQSNPIIIQAYPGDNIIFTTTNDNHNCIQLSGQYFVFQGFEFIGSAEAPDALPLRLMAGTSSIVLQDMKLHDLYENAITANIPGADYFNITFRRLEIWNTAHTGECIYAGCQGSGTSTPCQIHDSLFEDNYCHDTCLGGGNTECTGGSMGSGFQIKFGSYNNVIRNNVCYNVNSPCVLLYDDFDKGANIVEGNLIINTAGDSGIQVAAGAIIRNNIVINSQASGITVTANPVDIYNNEGNRNVQIYHNTLINNGKYGLEFEQSPTNTVVFNNVAIGSGRGDISPASQNGNTWYNNAYNAGGLPSGVQQNSGAFLVGTAAAELVDPTNYNVYPKSGSKLINAGYQGQLAYDFDYNPRSGCTPTVGAYEFTSSGNPAWTPSAGIKSIIGTVAPCTSAAPCPIPCVPVVQPIAQPPVPIPNPVIPDPIPNPVIPDPIPNPVIPDPVPNPVIPDPVPTAPTYALFTSPNSDFSNAQNLNTAGVQGPQYIYVTPEDNIAVVQFELDDPTQLRQTEHIAPFEFVGGLPWDTTLTSNGAHTIYANITGQDGTFTFVTATFNVLNGVSVQNAMTDPSQAYNGQDSAQPTSQNIPLYVGIGVVAAVVVVVVIAAAVILTTRVRGERVERP